MKKKQLFLFICIHNSIFIINRCVSVRKFKCGATKQSSSFISTKQILMQTISESIPFYLKSVKLTDTKSKREIYCFNINSTLKTRQCALFKSHAIDWCDIKVGMVSVNGKLKSKPNQFEEKKTELIIYGHFFGKFFVLSYFNILLLC